MSDIKQSHSYSEFHDFNSGRANLSWAGGDSVNKLILGGSYAFTDEELILGGSYAFTDEELQGLVDLINEFLLWKKYRYTATLNEGDSFRIVPKTETGTPLVPAYVAPFAVPVAPEADEDATGVAF